VKRLAYCVMVRGPCRGNRCDFWARIKIRKKSITELVEEAQVVIIPCQDQESMNLRTALDEYWKESGISDMYILCLEEPDLCEKIASVEAKIKYSNLHS